MEIKKVLNLGEAEKTALIGAGELLAAIHKMFENSEIDALSDEAKNLVKAVEDIATKVVGDAN